MVHRIGGVPGLIVTIIIVIINDHRCIAVITISTTVMIGIMMINADRHYGSRSKIGRLKSVIIRRNIGHINRRVNVLYDRG